MSRKEGRFKKFLVDLPILDLPFKKPEVRGFFERVAVRLLGQSGLSRTAFVYQTYLAKPGKKIGLLAFSVFVVGFIARIAPPVHTWRLEKAYKDRYDRHLKYLDENPKYESALLHGYRHLAAPK